MSERDLLLLLEDITFSINHIFDYTRELSLEKYEQDQKTKDAVERNFMIIGEAVSRIPDDFKSQHQQVEWRIIKDFRNFIIHEYFGINDRKNSQRENPQILSFICSNYKLIYKKIDPKPKGK